ncbi:MAG: ribonuclease P protein component [Actinomycetota bacterium]
MTTGANDVQRVLATGRAFHGDRVVVFVAPGSGVAAFVAGRRVGGAVERNRARRILRAAWRDVAPRVRDGYDVALVARGTIRGARAHELVPEVERLLSRAQVMLP